MTVAFDVGFKTDQSFFAKLADEKERVIKEINDSASAATAINAMNGLRTELDGIKAHMAEIHKSVTELTEIKSLYSRHSQATNERVQSLESSIEELKRNFSEIRVQQTNAAGDIFMSNTSMPEPAEYETRARATSTAFVPTTAVNTTAAIDTATVTASKPKRRATAAKSKAARMYQCPNRGCCVKMTDCSNLRRHRTLNCPFR